MLLFSIIGSALPDNTLYNVPMLNLQLIIVLFLTTRSLTSPEYNPPCVDDPDIPNVPWA